MIKGQGEVEEWPETWQGCKQYESFAILYCTKLQYTLKFGTRRRETQVAYPCIPHAYPSLAMNGNIQILASQTHVRIIT
jgi:hypothetical protein